MRIIALFDMDAFFASIEERDNPLFRGLPIVVGADPKEGKGRGVVSTANYQARKYGIHSAMPISRAWRLSEKAKHRGNPPAVFLPVNIEHYAEVSARIMQILRRSAPLVEEAGIDEAYLDLSFARSFKKAREICEKIKQEIKASEQLTASVGIGPNKLIAKIASAQQKPDGLTVVTPKQAETFLAPLPIREIPGIGPKTEMLLKGKGVKAVRDLRKLTRKALQEALGKRGSELYEKVRARNETPIVQEYEVKSIGEQTTFPEDTNDPNFVSEQLRELCRDVFARLHESGFGGFRTVTITVRFADFETKTRSHTVQEPIATNEFLESEAIKLFLPFLGARENPRNKKFRLVGVSVGKLIQVQDAAKTGSRDFVKPSAGGGDAKRPPAARSTVLKRTSHAAEAARQSP
jgi:DNA polymerase IV (archaeal DinB-like DNA polymerase)